MPMMSYLTGLFDSLNRSREGRWLVAAAVTILYLLVFIAYTFIALVDMTRINLPGFFFLVLASGFLLVMLGFVFSIIDFFVGAILEIKQYLAGPKKSA